MTQPAATPNQRPCRLYRRFRRTCVWGFAFVVFGLIVATLLLGRFYTDPKKVRELLVSAAPRWFPNSTLAIETARIRALGGVTLSGLSLKRISPDGATEDLMNHQQLRVTVDSRALVGGRLWIRRATLVQPSFHLHFDEEGRCTLLDANGKPPEWSDPATLSIEKGTLKATFAAAPDRPIDVTDLTGEVEFSPPSFAKLKLTGTVENTPFRLNCSVDVRGKTAAISELSFDRVTAASVASLLPADVRRRATAAIPPDLVGKIRLSGAMDWNANAGKVDLKAKLDVDPVHGLETVEADIRYQAASKRLDVARMEATGLNFAALKRWAPADIVAKIPAIETLSGRGDVKTEGAWDLTSDAPVWKGKTSLAFKELQWAPAALPHPLRDFDGRLTLNADEILLEEATGVMGPANVSLTGRAPLDDLTQGTATIDAVGLPISPEVYIKLPSKMQSVWQRFSPEGVVDLKGTATFRNIDKGDLKFVGGAAVRNGSTSYDRFPYRATNVKGNVQFRPDGRVDVDLSGAVGNGKVRLSGSAADLSPTAHMEMRLEVQGVAYDDQLRKAFALLPAGVVDSVNKIRATGTGDATASIRRKAGSTVVRTDVAADLQLRDFQADWFPLKLDQVAGRILLQRDRLEFQNVHGKMDSGAEVWMAGWMQRDGPPPNEGEHDGDSQLLLDFWAMNIPLDQRVRQALPDDWKPVWDHLRPMGAASLTCRVQRVGAEKPRLAFRFDAAKASMSLLSFPYRLEAITGPIELRNNAVAWKDLSARHGNTIWKSKSGFVTANAAGGEVHFDELSCPSMPVDEDLKSASPPAVRAVLDFLSPTTPLQNLALADFAIAWEAGDARPPSIEIGPGSKASFVNADMMPTIGAKNVTGNITLEGFSRDFPMLKGNVYLESIGLVGLKATGVTGVLRVEGPQIHFERLHGDFYRGELHFSKLSATVFPQPKFDAVATVLNASLKDYVRQAYREDVPVNASVNASVFLKGGGSAPLSGRGNLDMRDVDVLQLPVLIDQVHFLLKKMPEGKSFDTLHANFRIDGENVLVDGLNMENSAMSMSLHERPGRLHLKTGELHLLMTPVMAGLRVPFFADSLTFHVGGVLSDPVITPKPFGGTASGMKKMLTPVRDRKRN